MNDHAEELLGKYLDAAIDEREVAELLELVRKSPAFYHRVRQLVQLDEHLRQAATGDLGGDLLARAVVARLERVGQDTDFAIRVVRQLPPRRNLTTRRAREAPRSDGPLAWVLLSAAAVLVFVLALVLANRREAPHEAVVRQAPPIQEVPEAPLAPRKSEETPLRTPQSAPPNLPQAPIATPPTPGPTPAPAPALPGPAPAAVKREVPSTVVEAAPPAVQFEEIEGEVFAVVGATVIPARPGAPLQAGAGVDARGTASLLFPDGTRVELRGNTKLDSVSLGSAEEGKRITLRAGGLTAIVAHQPANRPLIVQSPHGRVEVLGTFLKVGSDSGSTRVEVLDGRVQVTKTDGTSALVRAGQGAQLSPSVPLVPQPLAPPKLGTPFTGLWFPENGTPRWQAMVDGRTKALSFASTAAEKESSISIWAAGTWNLVQGDLRGSMELVPDSKSPDDDDKRHELVLRIIEGRHPRPDQWIEIALTGPGAMEARVNGSERILGTVPVRDLLKARRALALDFEVTQTTLRVTAGGRTIFSGPHLLGGYGIVRVSISGAVHEAGGTSVDKILNPRLTYVPSAGK